MTNIYIIGNAIVDIFGKTKKDIIRNDSNIADIFFSYGGVARNIGANLASFKQKIYFASVFSNDHFGKELREDCLKLGFDLKYSKISYDKKTSVYLAILDQNNELDVGLVDTKLIEEIDKAFIDRLIQVVDYGDYVYLDANLDEKILEYACKSLKGLKICDAISANKVNRLKPVLDRIDILKLNKLEAETLVKQKFEKENDLLMAIKRLNSFGVKEVLLTVNSGVYVGIGGKVTFFKHNKTDKDVINTTGAGDSFLATYVYGYSTNAPLATRICLALGSALLTIKSEKAVVKYTLEDIKNELRKTNISCKEFY